MLNHKTNHRQSYNEHVMAIRPVCPALNAMSHSQILIRLLWCSLYRHQLPVRSLSKIILNFFTKFIFTWISSYGINLFDRTFRWVFFTMTGTLTRGKSWIVGLGLFWSCQTIKTFLQFGALATLNTLVNIRSALVAYLLITLTRYSKRSNVRITTVNPSSLACLNTRSSGENGTVTPFQCS